jgi:predicted nucleotidyltransferase
VKRLNNKRLYKKIAARLSGIKDLKAIILYGSFAREDYGPRSDIDLMLITSKKETMDELQDAIISLDVGRSIQPVIRTAKELAETDTGLLQNLFLEGKIIYLREPIDIDVAALLQLKPFLVYTFDLGNLDQKEKAKFNRAFYPRSRENYNYPGLLAQLSGQKLARGCVMIPFSNRNPAEKFFKSQKVKFSFVRVWK